MAEWLDIARTAAAWACLIAGSLFLLIGAALMAGFTLTALKLALIGLFIFVTAPTATHAIANAAFTAGLRPLGLKADASGEMREKDGLK